jgi:hypothetical protein
MEDTMSTPEESFLEIATPEDLGKGAYFWVYLSPQNKTAEIVKDWTVTLSQPGWSASISSREHPPVLQTEGRSGVFDVKVIWRQPPDAVIVALRPSPGSKPNIGCNENCAAMIGIVANLDGPPTYWTVWDAFCKKE